MEDNERAKRRRIDESEPLDSVAALRRALSPAQISLYRRRAGLLQFKGFLNSISDPENAEHEKNQQLLTEACLSSKITGQEEDEPFPHELISHWKTAHEKGDESALSNVPSVLALFFKTISIIRELKDVAIDLCKALIQKDECLQLFARGLTATKAKEHLISPCLRLLTEIVTFDAGEVAHIVHSRRESLNLRNLNSILGQKRHATESGNDVKKPTLRRIALRYVLACLRFQGAGAKAELITQGTLRACIQMLRYDQQDIALEILAALERYVVKDTALKKEFKTRLFSVVNLSALAGLYSWQTPQEFPDEKVREQIDSLLRLICTQKECGVLNADNGWYSSQDDLDESETFPFYSVEVQEQKISPKNTALAAFVQGLRPETDQLQSALVLDIFRVAPELVADYFSKKKNFILEPKDTPQWLGQSAFFFSVIQLPPAKYRGRRDGFAPLPPPDVIVLENILPRPLDRSVMTRSLNMNHEVITLFAVRALTVSFQKLSAVLEMYRTPKTKSTTWRDASTSLLRAFGQRCPTPKDVLSAFHKTAKSDPGLHAAILELLSLYYEHLPQLMLREKFDTSLHILNTLQRLDSASEATEKEHIFTELQHLLQIAQVSSDAKWWHKPDKLQYSVCTSILMAVVRSDGALAEQTSVFKLLAAILVEHGILPEGPEFFDALIGSLSTTEEWSTSEETISFFDDCACRIARKPLFYQDLCVGLGELGNSVPLLLPCLAEQWAFIAKKANDRDRENIFEWTARVYGLFFIKAGVGNDSVRDVIELIIQKTGVEDLKERLLLGVSRLLAQIPKRVPEKHEMDVAKSSEPVGEMDIDQEVGQKIDLEAVFNGDQTDPASTQDLVPFKQGEGIEDYIQNRYFARLCFGLSSTEEEVRRQAFLSLQQIMYQANRSDNPFAKSIYLLLGEVMETTKATGIALVLPTIASAFASEAATVLLHPEGTMYGKISKFLQRGPCWDLSRFIRYWNDKIFLREPEDDHGHNAETSWFLNLLIKGLQSEEDSELYRKSGILERLLTLYSSIFCSEEQRKAILELLYRSLKLGGGMTMITRVGSESWLVMEKLSVGRTGEAEIVAGLEAMLRDCTEEEAVEKWKYPVRAQRV